MLKKKKKKKNTKEKKIKVNGNVTFGWLILSGRLLPVFVIDIINIIKRFYLTIENKFNQSLYLMFLQFLLSCIY